MRFLRDKRILVLPLMVLTLFAFQNCGRSFSSANAIAVNADTVGVDPVIDKSVVCTLSAGQAYPDLVKYSAGNCTAIETPAGTHLSFTADAGTKLSIPSNISVIFGSHSSWQLNGDLAITIAGGYQIPQERQPFFLGTGTVTSNDTYSSKGCPILKRVAYPEWFGAVVNDGADDSVAINKALQLGNDVELAAGTYDLLNRIFVIRGDYAHPLLGADRQILGGQLLNGQSEASTILNQMANPNVIHSTLSGAHPEYQAEMSAIMAQDFIVGISSDCGRVTNLTIDGSRVPDDMQLISNWGDSGLPLIAGIQISSILAFKFPPYAPKMDPPVKNVSVQNVKVNRPASSCINIQSSRGVDGVALDSISCTARTARPNTSGVTIEAYGFAVNDNPYKNISITNSQFTGGRSVFYFAGAENLVLDNVDAVTEQGSVMNTLIYTSDVDFPLSATIKNSRFSHMFPPPSTGDGIYDGASQAVMVISGRSYANTYAEMPYLQPVNTSLTIENSTLQAPTYSAANPNVHLIPLIRDLIGLSNTIHVQSSNFVGGSYGILTGDTNDLSTFGAAVYWPNIPTRDVTPAEIDQYQLFHSSYFMSLCKFSDQAFSSIYMNYGNLQVFDSTFTNIGRSPAALDFPVIDLGPKSAYGPVLQNALQDDSYSGVNATAFLRMPQSLSVTYKSNAPFATSESQPANNMDSIRFK